MSKTCIITGASRGIGRAIAIALSNRDDITNFVLISRTEEGLKETAKQLNPTKNSEIYALDLTQYDAVKELVQEVGEKYGSD